MTETSKAKARRLKDGWYDTYLVGKGLDIGHNEDYVVPGCDGWEWDPEGDAQYLATLADESYDWVYASHCLEHMVDPLVALANWWRCVKPNGYLIVAVPEENLYEQGHWPSKYNPDHKSTWRLGGMWSWSPVSYDLRACLDALPNSAVELCRVVDTNYDYTLKFSDQSIHPHIEVCIEGVVRKRFDEEPF